MNSRLTLPLALLVPLMLVVGIWIGANPRDLPGPVRDVVGYDDSQRAISDAIDVVHDRYYRELSDKELSDKAIAGMVKSLGDEFSHYFNAREYQSFRENQQSAFSGVGLGVGRHPLGLRVRQVYDGSPAKRGGVKAGDVVTRAAGRSLKGLDQNKAVALIRGAPGTEVTVTIKRGDTDREIRLTRATINLPVVASRIVRSDGNRYALIGLAQFSSGAHAELARAVRKELRRGAKGIIFDLRGNPGGLVVEAQLVTSVFLKQGEVVTTEGRHSPRKTLTTTGKAVAPQIPLVVLVDRSSASAAEIVAGALQDNGRARLIGTRTFGKGVFQEVIELDNGGALDITAGQYFTPNGRNLGGTGTKRGDGLEPDIAAPDDPKTAADETLERALKAL
ncbi:MAG TPA: S41 family peptidase [Baekduia sp.]|nr:S41 family peptidase [Baekduia sp.]